MSTEPEILDFTVMLQLSEVGFLAGDMGLPDQAIAIFYNLFKLKPEIPHMGVNLALVYARYEKIEDAIELLLTLKDKFPQNQMVKAVLGMCLVQQAKPGAIELLDEVLTEKTDSDAMNIARSCYDLAKQQRVDKTCEPVVDGLQFFRHYNNQTAEL
jgi:predicted Zn-dependent protease